MIPNSSMREMINNEQIKKLRSFLTETLDSTDDKGRPDLEKIMNNMTYNMGEGAIEIGGLLLQETIKLEELEDTLRKKKKAAYEEVMTSTRGYVPNSEGTRTLVEGDDTVTSLTSKINRQKAYIDFLKQCQETVRYYPRNAQSLINTATYGKEIGKIL